MPIRVRVLFQVSPPPDPEKLPDPGEVGRGRASGKMYDGILCVFPSNLPREVFRGFWPTELIISGDVRWPLPVWPKLSGYRFPRSYSFSNYYRNGVLLLHRVKPQVCKFFQIEYQSIFLRPPDCGTFFSPLNPVGVSKVDSQRSAKCFFPRKRHRCCVHYHYSSLLTLFFQSQKKSYTYHPNRSCAQDVFVPASPLITPLGWVSTFLPCAVAAIPPPPPGAEPPFSSL